MRNIVKEKLKCGEKVLGCFVGIYSPNLIELIGHAGYDFVVIDDEHGAFSYSELENLVRTADSVNLVPIVRVSYDPSSIQKALDRGAKGIQVPMVNTKEQAELAVRKAKFPPRGTRGAAYSHRAARFGKLKGKPFLDASDENILVIPHIETEEAVQNFDEIINVEGVDAVFIGTTDLSVNMGYKEQGVEHPVLKTIVSDLYQKAEKQKIPIGTVAIDSSSAKQAYDQGASYVGIVAISSILKYLEEIKDRTMNSQQVIKSK